MQFPPLRSFRKCDAYREGRVRPLPSYHERLQWYCLAGVLGDHKCARITICRLILLGAVSLV